MENTEQNVGMNMENNKTGASVRIDNVNSEGIAKAGKHVDRAGSAKFNWKTILIVIMLLGFTVVGVATGIPSFRNKYVVPDIPFAVVDAMSQNEQSTFLDEVLAEQAKNIQGTELSLLEEVQQLELYLNLINDLNALNLTSYTTTIVPVTLDENFDKNLKTKYDRFVEILESEGFDKEVLSQQSLELHNLAAELNGYKRVVESKITTHGYEIVAEFGIYAVKTEVIDASGISYMNIDNLTIPGAMENNDFHVIYTDPTTKKEYKINVPTNSIVHKIIDSIYYAQLSSKKVVANEESVNSEKLTTAQIVKDLNKILNQIKVSMYTSHENDGKLKPLIGYNDIREAVQIPTESGPTK